MMNYNKNDFRIGFILYVICIPACLLYYVLTSYQLVSPFLGGYYPYAFSFSFIFVFTLQIVKLTIFNEIKLTRMDGIFIIFIVYAFLKISFDFSLGNYMDENIKDSFSGLIYFSAVYFIFRVVNFNGLSKVYFLSFFLLFFLISVVFLISSGVVVLTISQADNYAASYQYIAIFFILISLPAAAYNNNFFVRVLIYIFSISFLFLNGARTEFVYYLISIFILELFLVRKASGFFWLIFLMLSSFVTLYLSINYVTVFQDNRVVDLIVNLNNTSSGQARARLSEQGTIFIEENILFGGFYGYKKGEYIHNILSVWVDLGVSGFLLYFFLILSGCFHIVSFFKRSFLYKSDYALTVAMLIPSILFLIFSKSYGYILFSASLGMISSMKLRHLNIYKSGVRNEKLSSL